MGVGAVGFDDGMRWIKISDGATNENCLAVACLHTCFVRTSFFIRMCAFRDTQWEGNIDINIVRTSYTNYILVLFGLCVSTTYGFYVSHFILLHWIVLLVV